MYTISFSDKSNIFFPFFFNFYLTVVLNSQTFSLLFLKLIYSVKPPNTSMNVKL